MKCGARNKSLGWRSLHDIPAGFVKRKKFFPNNAKAAKDILEKNRPIAPQDRAALEVYEQVQTKCDKPCFSIALAALKVCKRTRDLEMGRKIHKDLKQSGGDSDVFVASTLISMYAKCGSMPEAYEVFQRLQQPDMVMWNCIIMGYAENGEGETALALFAKMWEAGCIQKRATFLAALRACTCLTEQEDVKLVQGKHTKPRSLERGKAIHALAVECESLDFILENTLVDMYGKCGSMVEARRVFDNMPARNVISWNCIIMGYADNGESVVALDLFSRMRAEGCPADHVTLLAGLKSCSCLADNEEGKPMEEGTLVKEQCLEKCRDIHQDIVKGGHELDLFVASSLLNLYAKCGGLKDAGRVFESMKHRDVVSWNCFISGCAQSGEGDMALQLYERMQREGCTPNASTILASLKACVSLAEKEQGEVIDGKLVKVESLKKGRSIHLAAAGKLQDPMVANAVLDMYAKCGSMTDAGNLFKQMARRDVVSWTTMIQGYAENGEGELALQLYSRILKGEAGFRPDAITFVAALKGCLAVAEKEEAKLVEGKLLKVECLRNGRAIHENAVQTLDTILPGFLGNALVDMYSKCGSIPEARGVFETMPSRDTVSWTSLIQGCAENEQGELALQLYARMQEQGATLSVWTYVATLKACGSLGDLDVGKKIDLEVQTCGLKSNGIVATSLVDCYAKCGSMTDAETCFASISSSSKDVACWNALLAGYSRQGDAQRSIEVFQSMLEQHVQPNDISFLSILTACSHSGQVDTGQQYFESMTGKYGIPPRIEHFNCMVDLLGRANRLKEAEELLRSMPFEASNIMWRALMGAARKWKNVAVGKMAFEAALKSSDRDNAAIYGQMANIYASVGMLEEARRVQAMRRTDAGISKKPGQSWWIDPNGTVQTFMAAGMAMKQLVALSS